MVRGQARHNVGADLDMKITTKGGAGWEVSCVFCTYAFVYVQHVDLLGRWFAP